MSDHVKLYIPGPIEVTAETYAAMSAPMIGHRSKDFQALYASVQPNLRTAFGTSQPVYLCTSSAWGIMEGSIRNLVAKKVLNCCCGAFSDKWYDVSLSCGKEAVALKVEWGQPITPELVDAGSRGRRIRRPHPRPQRNLHRRAQSAGRNRAAGEVEIPRRPHHHRHRLVVFHRAHSHG